jgi:hypothetical protein
MKETNKLRLTGAALVAVSVLLIGSSLEAAGWTFAAGFFFMIISDDD